VVDLEPANLRRLVSAMNRLGSAENTLPRESRRVQVI
jgi:hypothetical protein